MWHGARWIGLAVCLLGVGCSGEPTDPSETAEACEAPTWAGDEVLEVGTGEGCFTVASEGDEVPIVNGPQGGYHLWVGLRCRGCSGFETVRYGVRDAETDAPLWGGDQASVVEFDMVDGVGHGAGLTAFVESSGYDFDGSGAAMWVGKEVVLWTEVDLAQTTYTSEVRVRIGSVEHQRSSCPECN